ncbi:hypothetical protein EVAR_82369_1 [Eumeta japonica]|uniref:Uncharacterized protein n=1 Tax=Eumeta variegata TaxID=151549 RepID=A0A4C1UBA0_EUMVA|nr:hypothetical protein EVAR_82369_1 [Eumeta japonica]
MGGRTRDTRNTSSRRRRRLSDTGGGSISHVTCIDAGPADRTMKDTVADDNVIVTEYMFDNENDIAIDEIMKVLKRMKVGKAAGYDRVSSETLRGVGADQYGHLNIYTEAPVPASEQMGQTPTVLSSAAESESIPRAGSKFISIDPYRRRRNSFYVYADGAAGVNYMGEPSHPQERAEQVNKIQFDCASGHEAAQDIVTLFRVPRLRRRRCSWANYKASTCM